MKKLLITIITISSILSAYAQTSNEPYNTLRQTTQTVLYVDLDATGANDGSSWQNAFTDLQNALTQTIDGDTLWIAEGVYKPLNGASLYDYKFHVQNDLTLIGGFHGTETSLSERKWVIHPTILSGDIDGDDTTAAMVVEVNDPYRDDNSYTVLHLDGNVTVDGLTIQDGNAPLVSPGMGRYGAGIWCEVGYDNFIIRNCTLQNNSAQGDATINCTADGDTVNLTIENCKILNNFAVWGVAFSMIGINDGYLNGSITNSLIAGNKLDQNVGHPGCAGSIRTAFGAATVHAKVINNTFVNNTSSPSITNDGLIFVGEHGGNSATTASVQVEFHNNIFWGNSINEIMARGDSYPYNADSIVLKNNIIQAATAYVSTNGNLEVGTSTSDPMFVDFANENYELSTSSTNAVDMGDTTGIAAYIPSFTLQNRARYELGIDIGAFEYTTNTYSTIEETYCAGSTYDFNGTSLSSTGVYCDTLQNTALADSVITLILTEINPSIEVTATDTVICGNNQLTLTATGANSYVWNNGISNGVATSITTGGLYSVTATDINGCTVTESIDIDYIPTATDVSVAISDTIVCEGEDVSVTTGSSNVGFEYVLRDANESIIDGPTAGTGNSLTFSSGSLSNSATYNVYASSGTFADSTGLMFDGIDDYITADPPSGINYNTAYSFEAWVNAPFPNDSGYYPIYTIGNDSVSDIEIYIQKTTNDLVVAHNRNSVGASSFHNFADPVDNQWFHLAVVYDGTNVSVYYNGVLSSSAVLDAPVQSADVEVSIGYIPNVGFNTAWGSKNLLGTLDEIKVWAYARTATEIQNDMYISLNGSEGGLVSYFKLDGNNGTTTAIDHLGNHGSLNNFNTNAAWVEGAFSDAEAGNGCDLQMTQTVSVTVNSAPSIDSDINVISVCDGDSIALTASGGTSYTWSNGVIDGENFVPTETTYTVTGTDANGCTGIDSTEVNILANPVPAVSLLDSVTLQTGFSFSNYQWFLDSVAINGETTATTPLIGEGSYTVEVGDVHGCTGISAPYAHLVNMLDMLTGSNMSIYPNPASSTILLSGSITEITIADIQGKLIREIKSTNTKQLDISNLKSGVYIITLSNKSTSKTVKLVKQ